MATKERKEFLIEGADIRWLNFTGREGPYNNPGDKDFALFLPAEVAADLQAQGWPVKLWEPKERDEGDDSPPEPFLKIQVRFHPVPPTVVMLTNGGRTRTQLNDDTVEIIDSASIANVDLIVTGYEWEMPTGASGIKPYLKKMYVTIDEDELDRKYAVAEDAL